MRILTVRFSNLNSLYGEWKIDFTNEHFLNDGIFAITGPTGAGKSTILDAICLALYGRTPRLESIGLQGNEIMSRQRSDCFAEVTFETKHGTFRCFWEQHRAHKKIEGNLVDTYHEISEVGSGKVLTTKKREVAEAVETYTSMNFERFTRSMLLAQGEFAAFLQADANQRSPILEQITGTEIYSQISKRVSEKYGEQKLLLGQYEEESTLIQPLTRQQRQQKKGQEELFLLWANGAKRRSRALSETLANYRAIETQKELLTTLQADQQELLCEGEALKPEKERLSLALQAMEIEFFYTDYISKEKTNSADQKEYQEKQDELVQSQERLATSEAIAKSVRLQLSQVKDELSTKRSVFTSVRALDQTILHNQKLGDGIRKKLQQSRVERRENITELVTLKTNLEDVEQKIIGLKTWIQEHKTDASLCEELPTIFETYAKFSDTKHDCEREQVAVTTATENHSKIGQEILETQEQQAQIKREVMGFETEIGQIQKRIDSLLGKTTKQEYQHELQHLLDKQILLATIASLEAHRSELEDGTACPLCGALEHPYAKGNLPVANDVKQRIDTIRSIIKDEEDLFEKREQVSIAQRKSESNLVEKQTWLASLQTQQKQIQKRFEEAKVILEQSREKLNKSQTEMLNHLNKYFQVPIVAEGSEKLLQELERRERLWLNNQRKLEDSSKDYTNIKANVSRLEKTIEQQTHSIFTLHSDLIESRSLVETALQERIVLLGEADVNVVERALEDGVAAAEKEEQIATAQVAKESQQVEVLRNTISTLGKRIAIQKEVVTKAKEVWQSGLQAQGFADKEEFLAVRLSSTKRLEIQRTIKDFEDRLTRIAERLESAKAHLEELLAVQQEGWTEALLQAESNFFESQSLHYNQRIGAIKEQLKIDQDKRELYKTQQEKIVKQREVCNLWSRLNTLIGSHDGKKFRNFAQGLTFELLLAHANEHLKELSDRYLLAPDPAHSLEVAVLDLYQAGELRSARNLSGGESFLVSLALSLGLSTIASKNVQVDSLFLDEGFGTLDEETLEMALSALVTLHNQGKLVGIISHVGALQERIPTQISVIPIAGGMSRIVGPGCTQLG